MELQETLYRVFIQGDAWRTILEGIWVTVQIFLSGDSDGADGERHKISGGQGISNRLNLARGNLCQISCLIFLFYGRIIIMRVRN